LKIEEIGRAKIVVSGIGESRVESKVFSCGD